MELEVLSKNDMYIHPHEQRMMNKKYGGRVKEILLLPLHKVEEHDIMLEDVSEIDLMKNQMTTSHSMFIQVLESQMNQVLSCLYIEPVEGLPYGSKANITK